MSARYFVGVCMIAALSGCDEGGGYLNTRYFKKSISGPTPVVSADFEPMSPQQLADLINRSINAPNTPGPADATSQVGITNLDKALADFSNAPYATTQASGFSTDAANVQMHLRSARNEIVNELATISNTLCGEYEQSLKAKSSSVSFALGSLATAFGGAGAVFTNGTAAIFSGLAGVTSGVNAEYSKDLFQGLATSIIIPGIEKQRTALAQEMVQRMCFGLPTYPLSMAIADVVRYHQSCTMDKGIAASSQSLAQSNSIGLDTLKSTLTAIESIHNVMKAQTPPTPAAPGAPVPPAAPAPAPTPAAPQTPLGTGITLTECQPLDENGMLTPAPATSAPGKVGAPPAAPAALTGGAQQAPPAAISFH